MKLALCFIALPVALLLAVPAFADDVSAPRQESQHQMMKDCMAKQKASDSGMPKEDMKKSCKDVTKTERENERADKDTVEHSTESAPSH